jgi:hypothetical protein
MCDGNSDTLAVWPACSRAKVHVARGTPTESLASTLASCARTAKASFTWSSNRGTEKGLRLRGTGRLTFRELNGQPESMLVAALRARI